VDNSETTLATTSHGRTLNPPCLWEIPEDQESAFQLFKEQSSRNPRYARLSGARLRKAFWALKTPE
jgi:hypothetical protein